MQRRHFDYKLNTGRPWVNLLSRVLTHLSIVLSAVMVVVYFCDVYTRGEMSFLANPITKGMLLALCLMVLVNSCIQLYCLAKLRSMQKFEKLTEKKKD